MKETPTEKTTAVVNRANKNHSMNICAMVKSHYIGDGHPTFNRNPYNGYINPYYWVDDHLLYGNNGSLDPGSYRVEFDFQGHESYIAIEGQLKSSKRMDETFQKYHLVGG